MMQVTLDWPGLAENLRKVMMQVTLDWPGLAENEA